MAAATLLEAPADRPAGHRGWRGKAAFVAAVAALPPVAMSSVGEALERAGYLLVAAALVTAAVLIWTVRRIPALVAASLAAVACVSALVLVGAPNTHRVQGGARGAEMDYSFDADAPPITRAEAEAVPEGSTEDELEEILGSAAGSGTLRRRDGNDSRCLVYREQPGPRSFDPVFAFCFAGDRYASLHRW
jgi:hypothetical protein